MVVYVFSYIVLEHESYRKLVCIVYAHYQLYYYTDQVLRAVATL